MANRGWPSRWVVDQAPAAGTLIADGDSITLAIAGLGYYHALPVGMWDSGGEAEPGTKEIFELLDDPLEKAAHFVREGAKLFDVSPDNPTACARWISLFGVDAERWPPSTWYNLSMLLASLEDLAGKRRGFELGFRLLLGLSVHEVRYAPSYRYLDEPQSSRLGERFGHLGVDLVVGNKLEDLATLTLVVGPLELADYYRFEQDEQQKMIAAALDLLGAHQRRYRISWLVEDPLRAPRLGSRTENSRLGINSHMGRIRPAETMTGLHI
jgi:predicted component of type VI protein secretion system